MIAPKLCYNLLATKRWRIVVEIRNGGGVQSRDGRFGGLWLGAPARQPESCVVAIARTRLDAAVPEAQRNWTRLSHMREGESSHTRCLSHRTSVLE